jgi:hypothetical protein
MMAMKTHQWFCVLACVLGVVLPRTMSAQVVDPQDSGKAKNPAPAVTPEPLADGEEPYKNVWGANVLISNDGFGLGTYYRRALTPDLSGVVAFSISESKDSREVEQFDPYSQQTYTPGKLNRFLVFPLTFGVQYRLFREDIVDTFRPFVMAGLGPVMIYEMPYVTLDQSVYPVNASQVDFFKAIGRGHPIYTGTAYIGAGANFGSNSSNVFGVNFRYYFTYLFSGSLPSMYNLYTGDVAGTKNSFGGFFIVLNIGMGY